MELDRVSNSKGSSSLLGLLDARSVNVDADTRRSETFCEATEHLALTTAKVEDRLTWCR